MHDRILRVILDRVARERFNTENRNKAGSILRKTTETYGVDFNSIAIAEREPTARPWAMGYGLPYA